MSSNYPIHETYIHPELINDLARIGLEIGIERYPEFHEMYEKAVKSSMIDPYQPNTKLNYQLEGWRRCKYHSVRRPDRGVKPDYRFIYRYDEDTGYFFKLATGKRNAKGVGGDSTYYDSHNREKTPNDFIKEQ
ncbi:hypothetical protein [Priestia megaterium]|uniref:hypothetical protein n=1 Tax=Priestia megaterium TaxID=1404 RepID=UPI0022B904AC|nr:hypothetical protein [Priestia megaterium]MCZ8493595.1 hypothetical protein [Priestia megaterium]